MPRSPCSWNKVTFEALVKRWAGILISDGYRVYQPWVHGVGFASILGKNMNREALRGGRMERFQHLPGIVGTAIID